MISFKGYFILLAIFVSALDEIDAKFIDVKSLENLRIQSKNGVREINLNRPFDASLLNIRNLITKNGLDPMDVPDMKIPLGRAPDFWNTNLFLHHGRMQQLSTIYRSGDVTLQQDGNKISLLFNVGFETLDLNYKHDLRYLLFHGVGNFNGHFPKVVAQMLFEADSDTRNIHLKLFKILDIGDFTFQLEGHWIDGLLNLLIKGVVKLFRNQIIQTIENKTYEEINKQIRKYIDRSTEYSEIIFKNIVGDYVYKDIAAYKIDGSDYM